MKKVFLPGHFSFINKTFFLSLSVGRMSGLLDWNEKDKINRMKRIILPFLIMILFSFGVVASEFENKVAEDTTFEQKVVESADEATSDLDEALGDEELEITEE